MCYYPPLVGDEHQQKRVYNCVNVFHVFWVQQEREYLLGGKAATPGEPQVNGSRASHKDDIHKWRHISGCIVDFERLEGCWGLNALPTVSVSRLSCESGVTTHSALSSLRLPRLSKAARQMYPAMVEPMNKQLSKAGKGRQAMMKTEWHNEPIQTDAVKLLANQSGCGV